MRRDDRSVGTLGTIVEIPVQSQSNTGLASKREILHRVKPFWSKDLLAYPRLNVIVTFLCFAAAPIGGSLLTALFYGGASWSIVEAVRRRYPFHLDRTAMVLSISLAGLAFSYLVAAVVNGDLPMYGYRYLWLAMLLTLPFSSSLLAWSDKSALARAAVWGSACGCVGGFVLAVIQFYVIGGMWAEGGAANSLVFGTVTTFAAGVALAGVFHNTGTARLLLIVCFAAGLAAIAYSGARGVWPAVVLNTGLVIFVGQTGQRAGASQVLGMAVLVVCAVMGAALSDTIGWRFTSLASVWRDFFDNANYDSTLGHRVAMWEIGLDLLQDRPLFGYGRAALPELLSARLLSDHGIQAEYSHFHNFVLTTAVEAGLLGAGALLGVVATAAVLALKRLFARREQVEEFGAVLILVMLITLVTAGMTNRFLGHDILTTIFMLSLTVGAYLMSGSRRPVAELTQRA